jgi:hypothetical protein
MYFSYCNAVKQITRSNATKRGKTNETLQDAVSSQTHLGKGKGKNNYYWRSLWSLRKLLPNPQRQETKIELLFTIININGSAAFCWAWLTTQTQKKHTDIHAWSGIRTHDSGVRAGKDSLGLRPLGHCDHQTEINNNVTRDLFIQIRLRFKKTSRELSSKS